MTWMVDMSISSSNGCDLGKKDACPRGLHGSYTVGTIST
jgi:hypothetical protein